MNTEGKDPGQSFTHWITPKGTYQILPGPSGSYRIFTGCRVQYRVYSQLKKKKKTVESDTTGSRSQEGNMVLTAKCIPSHSNPFYL